MLFSTEGWRNWWCWGFRIIITVRVAFAAIMRRNTTWLAARFRHKIFAKISYARQRAVLYLKKLYTWKCEFLLKIHHLPSFWKSHSSTKLTHQPHRIEVSFLICGRLGKLWRRVYIFQFVHYSLTLWETTIRRSSRAPEKFRCPKKHFTNVI